MSAHRPVRALLLLLVAWGVAGSGARGDDEPTVTAAVDTTATTVGGRILLTVDADVPSGWFVQPPSKAPELGPFRLRSIRETERTEGHRRFVFALVATQAGNVEIPSIALAATHGSSPDTLQLATDPVPVTVASNLSPEETAPSPPDSAGVAGVPGAAPGAAPGTPGPKPADLKPPREAPRRWLPLAIAAGALLLAILVGFRVLRWIRAREPEERKVARIPETPARPAWEVALEELDAIREARYVEHGVPARQYETVSEALRRYLENRYGVPALESTTDDLRELLRRAPLPSSLASRVLSLLSEADLVKFAKALPDPADAESTEGRARSIVRETIPPPVQEVAA